MAGHIFISYSKRDTEFAFKLADDLTAQGRHVWIDRQIGGGERWRTSISQALRDANEMIVVLSPNSIASDWVMHEGSVASGLEKPIFPVMIAPVDKLPIWMEELQFVDFTTRSYEAAFDQLINALTPPNYLQDLLDQQVEAYKQTGSLISEALLHVIEEQRATLTIAPEAETLLEKSKQAVSYRRRIVRASAGAAIVLSIIALLAGISAVGAGAQINSAREQLSTAQAEQLSAQAQRETAIADSAVAEAAAATAQAAQAQADSDLATANAAVTAADNRIQQANSLFAQLYETTGTIPVGDRPVALGWDGTRVWTVNRQDNTVMPIDLSQGIPLATNIPLITISGSPVDVAIGGGFAWIAAVPTREHPYSTVTRIDLITLEPVGQPIRVGAQPVALAWDGTNLWIATRANQTIERLEAATLAVTEMAQLDSEPVDLLWTGSQLWTALQNNDIRRIDTATGQVNNLIVSGNNPNALAWDGTNLWISNAANNSIMQIDPNTGLIRDEIAVGRRPIALTWDGISLWVVNSSSNDVMQIGRATDTTSVYSIVSTNEVGNRPRAAVWTGGRLWVAVGDDNAVQRLDVEDNAVAETISTGNAPHFLVWTGRRLSAASSSDGTFRHIDPTNLNDTRATELTAPPVDVAWTGSALWVARTDGQLQVVFPDGRAPAEGLFVADDLRSLAWDGSGLWLATATGDLFRFDPLAQTRTTDVIDVGSDPGDVVWDGQHVWVSSQNAGTVTRYDPISDAVNVTTLGGEPGALLWDGTNLWAANRSANEVVRINAAGEVTAAYPVDEGPAALAWDGEFLWVANLTANTVSQIDPTQTAVQATIAVAEQPVALVHDGSTIWVASQLGTLQQLDTRGLALIARARRQAN